MGHNRPRSRQTKEKQKHPSLLKRINRHAAGIDCGSETHFVAVPPERDEKPVRSFKTFKRAFKDFGLPDAIRTDNGVPFASSHALFGLSKLSVWWLRLGIRIERIKPGHPEQNGRHERMHLTLKKEATKPAAGNFLQQQAKFDAFMSC